VHAALDLRRSRRLVIGMASLVREPVRVEVIEEFEGFTVVAAAAFADTAGHFCPLAMATELVAHTPRG
jgi:hypothetical protein